MAAIFLHIRETKELLRLPQGQKLMKSCWEEIRGTPWETVLRPMPLPEDDLKFVKDFEDEFDQLCVDLGIWPAEIK